MSAPRQPEPKDTENVKTENPYVSALAVLLFLNLCRFD